MGAGRIPILGARRHRHVEHQGAATIVASRVSMMETYYQKRLDGQRDTCRLGTSTSSKERAQPGARHVSGLETRASRCHVRT